MGEGSGKCVVSGIVSGVMRGKSLISGVVSGVSGTVSWLVV